MSVSRFYPFFLQLIVYCYNVYYIAQFYNFKYMSQVWKRGKESDDEVRSFCSIWGSGMDASGYADKPWQF